jgi:hypothetical protein
MGGLGRFKGLDLFQYGWERGSAGADSGARGEDMTDRRLPGSFEETGFTDTPLLDLRWADGKAVVRPVVSSSALCFSGEPCFVVPSVMATVAGRWSPAGGGTCAPLDVFEVPDPALTSMVSPSGTSVVFSIVGMIRSLPVTESVEVLVKLSVILVCRDARDLEAGTTTWTLCFLATIGLVLPSLIPEVCVGVKTEEFMLASKFGSMIGSAGSIVDSMVVSMAVSMVVSMGESTVCTGAPETSGLGVSLSVGLWALESKTGGFGGGMF